MLKFSLYDNEHGMKKLLLSILLALHFCVFQLHAQVSGNNDYNAGSRARANNQYNSQQVLTYAAANPLDRPIVLNDKEIVVTVNGLFNVIPEDFVATFHIVQTAETAETADQLLNERIKKFRQKFLETGGDATNFHVDMISFVPKYEVETENKLFSKTYNEIPAGFELQKNISIRYRHSAVLDELITAAASAEIYDLVKVDCSVQQTRSLIDSLRRQCLREIRIRSQSFEITGLKMDTLKKTISENLITVYPQTRYFTYQAYSRPSQHFARKKTAAPAYNEMAKTTSSYYSQLDYDRYDLIINPLVLEPVIQISCSVAVKYFLHAETKPANDCFLLTPAGELKKFNLK
ncbi:DUF541 domain-containing protein [Dyadobacter flavalbus]|uniref:DUF541 domain-containing protein n=1 Tax=Dyadobacter flavalbus TaxID=2579942 RepID=A0A5M8QED8_9BACT|nr:SIMPL domain-containing protein [Dyadobacter flavalbus]KAA6432762.1 DUF541 domain-containing protein [Dyadobacter flavalbus]